LRERERDVPSPNPKQGIKLSSRKGENFFPIMDIAFSHEFGTFLMSCKLCLTSEYFSETNIMLKLKSWLTTKLFINMA